VKAISDALERAFLMVAWVAVVTTLFLFTGLGSWLSQHNPGLFRLLPWLVPRCWAAVGLYLGIRLVWLRRASWWPWLRERLSGGASDTVAGPGQGQNPRTGWLRALFSPKARTLSDGPLVPDGPPLRLLGPVSPQNRRSGAAYARQLPGAFAALGIRGVEVTSHRAGPVVAMIQVKIPEGVRATQLMGLKGDLAAEIGVDAIRITPVQGAGGILAVEIPFERMETVPLRLVMSSPEFRKAPLELPIALGVDLAGQPVVADLTRMPHLLVAGTTGSGKSVCLNTIIVSLLYQCDLGRLRLTLIDPKVVELKQYNGLPHLSGPVITEPNAAIDALARAVAEMERRYQLMADLTVRNIVRYNQAAARQGLARLPYWVMVLDEFADLMEENKGTREALESHVKRLAAKARAAGIHLILATQRPSVDVITGVLKANIPSRIAFAVAGQSDSMTILGMGGAEDLRGRGDMLFAPVGVRQPVRVQGAFVSDEAVNEVAEWWKQNGAAPSEAQRAVEEEASPPETEDHASAAGTQPEASDLPPLVPGGPPLHLLAASMRPAGRPDDGKMLAAQVVSALGRAGVAGATIEDVQVGPSLTSFTVTPPTGVKVAALTRAAGELAGELGMDGVRHRPHGGGVPGIVVEVPRDNPELVFLQPLVTSPAFRDAVSRSGELMAMLGVTGAGEPLFLDVARAPHLLVGGTTGSGKSTVIQGGLLSLLLAYPPETLRLILCDPKLVEFTLYQKLPHLLCPLLSETAHMQAAVSWLVTEMDRRYSLFAAAGAKDLRSYNAMASTALPRIVLVADELSDLLLAGAKEARRATEQGLVRLAQKARACGIHLLLGTQKPTVEVIPSLLKGNIPARVACRTMTRAESGVILDRPGAESLRGNGDMLVLSPAAALTRGQGVWIEAGEVERVTGWWAERHAPVHDPHLRALLFAVGFSPRTSMMAAGGEPERSTAQARHPERRGDWR